MGRSPLFEYFARVQISKGRLDNFQDLVIGNKVRFVFKKPKTKENGDPNIDDVILNTSDVIARGLSRTCSTYGRKECFIPKEVDSFIITKKTKYNFWRIWEYDPWNPYVDNTIENIFLFKKMCEKYILPDDVSSHLQSFLHVQYEYIDIEIEDQEQLATFVIRSDGSILDYEDFSIRGYVEKIVVIQQTKTIGPKMSVNIK